MNGICFRILMALLLTLYGCGGGSNEALVEPVELKVVSIAPVSGANVVARDGNIAAVFSENIIANTVNTITFNVKDDQNKSVVAEIITVNGNQAIFKSKFKLYPEKKYTVTITSGIKGVNGGVLAENYVSNFTTQNSQWSNPELFGQANLAKTAVDNHGNSIIVWWRYNNSNSHYEIVMSQLIAGIWSEPKVISGNATNVYSPSVAMDNKGNAIIIWEDWNWESGGGIVITEFRDGVWSAPRFISQTPLDNLNPPSLAMNDNGKAIIVWSQNEIFISEYKNSTWSQPVAISSGGNNQYPKVLINSSGNAIITWSFSDGSYSGSKLLSKEYIDGYWTDALIISATGNVPIIFYDIAFDNNNNAIVVWQQIEGSTYRLYRNEYRELSWIGPNPVSPDGVYVLYPKVAMDNSGNAVMAWQQSVDNIWQVYISELRTGLWNTPSQISTPGIKAASPLIKMDNSGNAILLWNQADGTDWQMFRSQYTNGAWSNKYLLAVSHDQLNHITYDLIMNGSGDADVVWSLSDGSNWQLYRSKYN